MLSLSFLTLSFFKNVKIIFRLYVLPNTRQKCIFICGNAHDHREGLWIYIKKGLPKININYWNLLEIYKEKEQTILCRYILYIYLYILFYQWIYSINGYIQLMNNSINGYILLTGKFY